MDKDVRSIIINNLSLVPKDKAIRALVEAILEFKHSFIYPAPGSALCQWCDMAAIASGRHPIEPSALKLLIKHEPDCPYKAAEMYQAGHQQRQPQPKHKKGDGKKA